MSEHTKGPWKWSTKCDTENRSLTGNEEYLDQHGEHIPIAYLHEGYRSEATKRANARLIAAAPDLLKACKNMIVQFVKYTPQLNHATCWEIIEAKAAIAKAERGE